MSEMQSKAGAAELGHSAPIRVSTDRLDETRQWTLKGLAPETVTVSREAAKRSGMKLNAWVSQALKQAANSDRSIFDEYIVSQKDDFDEIQHIKDDLVSLRAQNDDMRKTMETMNKIILKLCVDKI